MSVSSCSWLRVYEYTSYIMFDNIYKRRCHLTKSYKMDIRFFKKKAYRQDSRVKCSLCGSEFPVARGGRADIKGSLKISSRHKNGIDEWLFEINFYVSKVLNGVTTIWICPQLSLTTLQLFTISALILMFVRLNWCLHLSSLSLPSVKQSVVRLMFYASSLL